MMLLDVIIAGLLAITSSYCWRLNRKIAGFRNAKNELEHMIRSFDSSIRQAYESIAILKENSSDKNIQLIRDMEKVRFLANDLAYLVEKGEKLANSLETTVRQPRSEPVEISQMRAQPRPLRAAPRPLQQRPQPQFVEEQQPRVSEVRSMIDTLARSYVADQPQVPPSLPPRALQQRKPVAATPVQTQAQRVQTIEKVLNHIARQNERGVSTMPTIPPREITQKIPQAPRPVAAAATATNKRFFDTLRVITPDE